jgi:hypothetical protein
MIYQAFRFAYEYAQDDEARFYQAIRNKSQSKSRRCRTRTGLSARPLVRPDPDVTVFAYVSIRLAE